MADVKVANNAFGQLASSITTSSTSITVGSGEGDRFPAITGSEYFYATLANLSNLLEIVKVTARSGDVFTVVRAQDNTTAKAYDAGDRIELRPVAALFEDLITDGRTAAGITYDDSTTSLGETDVQGAIEALASAPSDQLLTANWTVEQSGTDLIFKYNTTTVFKITSAGAIVAADNITAYGSP